MTQLVQISSPEQLKGMPASRVLPPLDHDSLVRHDTDAHWTVIQDDGMITGRCSLWWRNTPRYQDHRIGAIGHYAASNRATARQILHHCCEQLAAHGCTLALAPMDGNTWRQYRLATELGSEPAFFLEPTNPESWIAHFEANGFERLAHYFSALNVDLSRQSSGAKWLEERIRSRGVQIRTADRTRFEDDLRRIYTVANMAFRHNLLYTPIEEQQFIRLYLPLRQIVLVDFVLIAERDDEPVGFVFAVPDRNDQQPERANDTVIVKTLGILPGHRLAGLGSLLLDRVRSTARALGYTRMIHAMVREVGHLRRMSGRSARQIRRYALFGKDLKA